MSFGKRILTWRSYTTNKALLITEQVLIINKKNFVIVALDINSETFIMYVVIQEEEEMLVHSKRQAQIKAQVGAWLFNKAFIKILAEYSNYNNIFSVENAVELPENTGINEHAIELEKDKQPFFGSIYSLKPVKLETVKTYIKTNLANGFIRAFKSPVEAFFLTNKKLDRSLRFYIDYWNLNNLIIKN